MRNCEAPLAIFLGGVHMRSTFSLTRRSNPGRSGGEPHIGQSKWWRRPHLTSPIAAAVFGVTLSLYFWFVAAPIAGSPVQLAASMVLIGGFFVSAVASACFWASSHHAQH